jgi:hypothetical protein
MWVAEGQLEPLVENQRFATFPLQTAQNMAGKNLKAKSFGLIFKIKECYRFEVLRRRKLIP